MTTRGPAPRTSPGRTGADQTTDAGSAPAGVVVALCAGHRCAALTTMCGDSDLSGAVARSRGGILISVPCLQHCAEGAIGAVAIRSSSADVTGPSVWFGGLDSVGRLQALSNWVEQWQPTVEDSRALPQVLNAAVLGPGPPIRLAMTNH